MTSPFASAGDTAEKAVTFSEIGPGLHAFTAEGDPNSGVIVGDDAVMVVEAQATPRLARQVIERVRSVTEKAHHPPGADALPRGARARGLGLRGAHGGDVGGGPLDGSRAGAGGLGERVRPLPAPVPGARGDPRAHLAHGHVLGPDVGLSGAPAGGPDASSAVATRRATWWSTCRTRASCSRATSWSGARPATAGTGISATGPARWRASGRSTSTRWRPAGATRCRGREAVGAALDSTEAFLASTYRPAARVAWGGGSLKEAWDAVRAECDPSFADWAIYEHCLPFNVARAYDEARGIDTPRIWTAERDREMWAAAARLGPPQIWRVHGWVEIW